MRASNMKFFSTPTNQKTITEFINIECDCKRIEITSNNKRSKKRYELQTTDIKQKISKSDYM